MKLATLKSANSRDGQLIVVSKDNQRAIAAEGIAPSLRLAIEDWQNVKARLENLYHKLNDGPLAGSFVVDPKVLHSPLPRAFQWVDGSAFIHHVKLVRMARGAPIPETLTTVPLMYQGGSDAFLAPLEDIPQIDFNHGTDFEGEVAVIVDEVPMGITAAEAIKKVILFVVVNDVSLRGLIPEELAQGFGFLQSKPSSAFAPFAVTEEELGGAWFEGRLHLPLNVEYNGSFFGKADAGAMHFHFWRAHRARRAHTCTQCRHNCGERYGFE